MPEQEDISIDLKGKLKSSLLLSFFSFLNRSFSQSIETPMSLKRNSFAKPGCSGLDDTKFIFRDDYYLFFS
jgi:hypothetical protein